MKSNVLSKESIQDVLASLTGSFYQDQNVLCIVNAFEIPRLSYDPIRKIFYRWSSSLTSFAILCYIFSSVKKSPRILSLLLSVRFQRGLFFVNLAYVLRQDSAIFNSPLEASPGEQVQAWKSLFLFSEHDASRLLVLQISNDHNYKLCFVIWIVEDKLKNILPFPESLIQDRLLPSLVRLQSISARMQCNGINTTQNQEVDSIDTSLIISRIPSYVGRWSL